MSLASAKQQERGNASCATILRKRPVREPSLPSSCCPESLAPLGSTGPYEPCHSGWPSSFLLSCSNAQGGAGSPLPHAEKGVPPKWDWEKGKRWRERERNINQKWAREATPSLPQMTLRLRERQACSQKPQGKETGLKGERMRKPCHLVVIPHTPAPWRRYVKSETFKEWGTIWRVPS